MVIYRTRKRCWWQIGVNIALGGHGETDSGGALGKKEDEAVGECKCVASLL